MFERRRLGELFMTRRDVVSDANVFFKLALSMRISSLALLFFYF